MGNSTKHRDCQMSRDSKQPHNLEDYEPGATREQVFKNLSKVAQVKKKPEKADDLPPEQASSET